MHLQKCPNGFTKFCIVINCNNASKILDFFFIKIIDVNSLF